MLNNEHYYNGFLCDYEETKKLMCDHEFLERTLVDFHDSEDGPHLVQNLLITLLELRYRPDSDLLNSALFQRIFHFSELLYSHVVKSAAKEVYFQSSTYPYLGDQT